MARTREASQTCYQALHVHPAAPQDLITAAYWKLTGLLQASRESDRAAEAGLYHLTRAYQILADHRSREAYDQSLGLAVQPLPRIPLRRRSSWLPFARRAPEAEADKSIDYYEMLRLDPNAHPAVLSEAYSVMRNYYLRLAEQGQARPELVYLLEEAYEVLSNPEDRSHYDESRRKNGGAESADSGEPGRSEHHSGTNAREPRTISGSPSHLADRSVVESLAEPPQKRVATQTTVVPATNLGGNDVRSATADASPVPSSPVTAASATPATADSDNGLLPEDSPAGLMTLLSASAQLLAKVGVESVRLARAASRTLREKIDISARGENQPGPADDEEEAVLARIFVSSTVIADAVSAGAIDEGALALLTVTDGPGANASYEVRKVPAILGADVACDIRLTGLASNHARLLHYGGHYVLHALTDDPAIRVQGNSVSWALLRDGDSVEVGPYHLRFNLAK